MSDGAATDKSHCTVEGCGREVWLYPTKGWVHWSWAAADHEAVPQDSKLLRYHVVITVQQPGAKWHCPDTYTFVIGAPTDDPQMLYRKALTVAVNKMDGYGTYTEEDANFEGEIVVLFYGAWPVKR